MECPGEEIVAAGKLPLAAYFGHSYLVTGAFGRCSSKYPINITPEYISSKVERI